jgi:hypothetical protein
MIIMPTQQPTTNMASANAVDPHMMGSICLHPAFLREECAG